MNERHYINRDFPRHGMRPMSDDMDLVAEIILINHLNPKVCWEIGTGKADWALFINQYMNISPEWHLTENFDWATTTNEAIMSYIPDNWPKNLTDINNHIRKMYKKNKKEFKYTLYDQDILKIQNNKLVDLWRIDCDFENLDQSIEHMLEYSSDNVIFFVDDIIPSRCINRFVTMMDQVRRGNLELVWVGIGEAAWTKPNTLDLPNMYHLFQKSAKYFRKFSLIDDKIIYNRNTAYFVIE